MKRIIAVLFMLLLLTGCSSGIKKIDDVNEFDSLIKSNAIKYDIRSTEDCEAGHIPGFMCMGDDGVVDIIKDLYEKDQAIIIIATDEVALATLKELQKEGYKKLYYFANGYQGYKDAKGDSFIPEEGCGC